MAACKEAARTFAETVGFIRRARGGEGEGREGGGAGGGEREGEADLCSVVGPETTSEASNVSLNDAPVFFSMGAPRSSACQQAKSFSGAPALSYRQLLDPKWRARVGHDPRNSGCSGKILC